jgi:hypothetical protein
MTPSLIETSCGYLSSMVPLWRASACRCNQLPGTQNVSWASLPLGEDEAMHWLLWHWGYVKRYCTTTSFHRDLDGMKRQVYQESRLLPFLYRTTQHTWAYPLEYFFYPVRNIFLLIPITNVSHNLMPVSQHFFLPIKTNLKWTLTELFHWWIRWEWSISCSILTDCSSSTKSHEHFIVWHICSSHLKPSNISITISSGCSFMHSWRS